MNKKILFMGTFDPAFGRNRQLVRLAELSGYQVETKTFNIWGEDKVNAATQNMVRTASKAVIAYLRIALHVLKCGLVRSSRPLCIVIPHPSQIDALVIAPLARVVRVPVVMDFFVSLHETVITDRGLGKDTSVKSRLLKMCDSWSASFVTTVLADTPENAEAFSTATKTRRTKWNVVQVGADPAIYQPHPEVAVEPKSVLFYGTYIPLQGIHVVVHAAKLLPADYKVMLIGNGQLRTEIEELIALIGSPVQLIDQVPESALPQHIARAEICLGIFGEGPKTQKVIPNKVYQCLAMGKPVITGSSPAVSILGDAVVTVPVGNAEELAEAIQQLMDNPERKAILAARAQYVFQQMFSDEVIARNFASAIADSR